MFVYEVVQKTKNAVIFNICGEVALVSSPETASLVRWKVE